MMNLELRTERIARYLCIKLKKPQGFWELMLPEAYKILFYGDKLELEELEKEIEEEAKRNGQKKSS